MRHLFLIAFFFCCSLLCQAKVDGDAVLSYSVTDSCIIFHKSSSDIILTPYSSCVWKVTAVPKDCEYDPRPSVSVAAVPCKGNFTVKETPGVISVSTGESSVNMDRTDGRLSFLDSEGKVVLSEDRGLDNASAAKTISFLPSHDGAFYGGGFNGNRTNLDGMPLVMSNTQNYSWESETFFPTSICIPFVVSSEGYGIYVDDHTDKSILFPSSTGGTSYLSYSRTPISYYYISGDGTMGSVLENYTFLTGRQSLPPYWSMGYLCSRYGYHSEEEVNDVISSLREADMPVDGLFLDLFWEGEKESSMGELGWYSKVWPDPEGMLARLKAEGVHVGVITEPFFSGETSNYSILDSLGFLCDKDAPETDWISEGKVGLIDTSNPKAMEWMWTFYRRLHDQGVSAFWMDLGEPETISPSARFHGGSQSEVHNEFGLDWIASVHDHLVREFPYERHLLVPRSGTAGMQRYGTAPWTGDVHRSWSGFRGQIPAILSGGMSGVGYLNSDAGGFVCEHQELDPDLYLRWVELSVFSPVMRTHSQYLPEPFQDEYSKYRNALRDLIHLRYSFLPYNYTLCYENATKGWPLARPLAFAGNSEDKALLDDCTEYLWGNDILVAPVLRKGTSREVRFPKGRWISMDLEHSFEGETTSAMEVPMEEIPVFYRYGAFIPRYSTEGIHSSSDIDFSKFEVTYIPSGGRDSGYMFEDDHVSAHSLEESEYQKISFSANTVKDRIEISVKTDGHFDGCPSEREIELIIPASCVGSVSSVTVNGKKSKLWRSDKTKLTVPVRTVSGFASVSVRRR